jgi:hypothetical protein
MWSRRSDPAPRLAETPQAPQRHGPPERQQADRCGCKRQRLLHEPAIGAFLNHHLRPIARLAPNETEWVCPSTLLHWRLIDHGGSHRELERLDPILSPPG